MTPNGKLFIFLKNATICSDKGQINEGVKVSEKKFKHKVNRCGRITTDKVKFLRLKTLSR